MADPVKSPIENPIITNEDIVNNLKFTDSADGVQKSIEAMSGAVSIVSTFFSGLSSKLESTDFSLQKTQQQFGLLSLAAVGAGESFKNFGDTKSLNTFSGQITGLYELIKNSPAFQTAASKTQALSDALTKIGIPVNSVTTAAKSGFDALTTLGNAFAKSADEALLLQNGYLQLSAKTGVLGNVLQLAGDNFQNLNEMMSEQRTSMADTKDATGATTTQITQFYQELGSIPGALNAFVQIMPKAAENTSMLTAAMLLASGEGRTFAEITADLKTAFANYGLVGEPALKFTSRISELSNKFNIQLEDVRAGIISTSSTFKGFADEGNAANKMAEGGTAIFNEYIASLRKTGATGQQSVDIITKMIGSIKDMSVAQKSFLSAQTGGPGGLMGGFQIDKMMRDGDIKGVMDKVKKQIQQQLGSIVTLDDAAKSQAAASQFQKQLLILQQGPLGKLATSSESASRLLESFKSGNLNIKNLDPDQVQNDMKKGLGLAKLSKTGVSDVVGLAERFQGQASTANLGNMQQIATAGSGQKDINITEATLKRQDLLSITMQKGIEASANQTGSAIALSNSMLGLSNIYNEMKLTAETTIENGKKLFLSDKPVENMKAGEELKSDISQRRSRQLSRLEKRSGVSLGDAARASTANNNTAIQNNISGEYGTNSITKNKMNQSDNNNTHKVDLTVTAICDHCKHKLETKHLSATSTGAANQ